MMYEGWVDFNCCSEEIQKIKQGRNKSKGLFSLFMGKPDPVEEYIKSVMLAVGLQYEALRFPLYQLSNSVGYKTAIFMVQQSLTKREERGQVIDRGRLDVHINDFKGKFELTE